MHFARKRDAERHETTHTGDKLFQCEVCKKRFSRKDELKLHKMRHGVRRLQECQHCRKRFRDVGSLKMHIAAHQKGKLKRHSCDVCGLKFTRRRDMVRHKLTHSDVKPHECGYCDKRYTRKDDLQRHERIHVGKSHKKKNPWDWKLWNCLIYWQAPAWQYKFRDITWTSLAKWSCYLLRSKDDCQWRSCHKTIAGYWYSYCKWPKNIIWLILLIVCMKTT